MIKYVLFIALFWAMFGASACQLNGTPIAKEGLLDLSEVDFQKSGSIALDGEWELYWERLLSPKDYVIRSKTSISNMFSGYYHVPSVWNHYRLHKKSLPSYGYATFRLNIIVPEKLKRISFKTPPIASAYRLWINNRVVHSSGIVATNESHYLPDNKEDILTVSLRTNIIEIVLQIANFSLPQGGIKGSFLVGEEKNLQKIREYNLVLESVIIGVFILMSFYSLFRTIVFKQRKASYFVFTLFCLSAFIHVLISGDTQVLLSDLGWETIYKLSRFSLYLTAPLLFVFIYLFNARFFRLKVIVILSAIGAIFSLVVLVTPLWVFAQIHPLYYTLFLGSILYFLVGFLLFQKKRKQKNPIWIVILSILLLASIYDFLHYLFWYNERLWITYGYSILVLLLSYIITVRTYSYISHSKSILLEFENLKSHWESIQRERAELEKKERDYLRLKESINKRKTDFLNKFTQREREIINNLIHGDNFKDIGNKLHIAEKTVNVHTQNIYRKAEVKNRVQLINLFVKLEEDPDPEKPLPLK